MKRRILSCPSGRRGERGSALATVMLVSLALVLLMTGILRYTLSERRDSQRLALELEAENAAEALTEYGVAQVRQKLGDLSDFSPDRFQREAALPLAPAGFWTGSKLLLSGPRASEVLIGNVNRVSNETVEGEPFYFYARDDALNANDPMKGHRVHRYDTTVIARANVDSTGLGSPVAGYVSQTLIARALPVFAYAVFYNMDLEVVPGGDVDVTGPVHTNGNLYVRTWTENFVLKLNFHDMVTVAGFNRKPGGPLPAGVYAEVKWPIHDRAGKVVGTTPKGVSFAKLPQAGTGAITSQAMSALDHRFYTTTDTPETAEAFRKASLTRWQGGLLTPVHGVMKFDVSSVGGYAEDLAPADGVDTSINDAHRLIEPPIAAGQPGYDLRVERQKFSRQCGLYIVVNPSPTSRTGRLPDGSPVIIPPGHYRAFMGSREVVLPGQRSYGANNGQVNEGANASGPAIVTVRSDQMYDLRRADFDWRQPRSAANPYNPRSLDMIDIDMTALKLAIDASLNRLSESRVYFVDTPPIDTDRLSPAWVHFIYNPAAVPTTVPLTAAHQFGGGFDASRWNGGIYIESIDATLRKDSGVRLVNGRGRLASKGGQGLTVATNDAVYVLGHYNADGIFDVTNSDYALTVNQENLEQPEAADETPCAIVGDAVTLLNAPTFQARQNEYLGLRQISGWNDAFSLLSHGSPDADWRTNETRDSYDGDGAPSDFPLIFPYRVPYDKASGPMVVRIKLTGGTNEQKRKFNNGDIEISAAFLAGIVPSNKNGNGRQSGSLSSYTRYLGHGGTLALRGSLVCLFESRVATEPWSLRVYGAPRRFVGLHEYFAKGRFPPLTPPVISYRRGPLRRLTPTEYTQAKATLSAW